MTFENNLSVPILATFKVMLSGGEEAQKPNATGRLESI